MKSNTKILLGTLAVLMIATFFVLRQPGEQSAETSAGKPLVAYDSSAIDKLVIVSTSGTVTVERQGGKWMITSPVRYAADEASIFAAIGKGRELKTTALVSSNPAKQSTYSVDSTSTQVSLFANGSQVASFRVGKPSSSWTETYVRQEGSNDVYSVEGALGSIFAKAVNDWRDKTIFKADQGIVSAVKFQYGDTTFTLAKRDTINWVIGSDSTINANVTSFLGSLVNFQADEFVDSTITAIPKLTGVIEVRGTQLRLYRRADGKHYVQSSVSPQWFAVQEWKATQVLKRKKDFVPTK